MNLRELAEKVKALPSWKHDYGGEVVNRMAVLLLIGDFRIDAAIAAVATDQQKDLRRDVESLRAWIADLQDGGFVNCVYCGHRYGRADRVAASLADVLKAHVAACPEHPLRVALDKLDQLRRRHDAMYAALVEVEQHCPCGARPESPNTHPHVFGCPVGNALHEVRA